VLFDLDGTLVDSFDDIRDALNALLVEEGLRPVAREEARAMFGDGAQILVARALRATGGDAARAPEFTPRYLAHYEPVATRRTRVYPGVIEVLQSLADAGFALAVVTNKPERGTRIVLDALDLSPLVQAVVGGDTLATRKPDPAPVREALRRLGVVADRAVMVGDSHHGVEAAHAAGVAMVAVSYGYAQRPPHELGADRVIDHFGGLPAALDALAECRSGVEAMGRP
jgi:phosphoglycolate phosphatase